MGQILRLNALYHLVDKLQLIIKAVDELYVGFFWIYLLSFLSRFNLNFGSPSPSIDSILPHSEEERICDCFWEGDALSLVMAAPLMKRSAKVKRWNRSMLAEAAFLFYWKFMI